MGGWGTRTENVWKAPPPSSCPSETMARHRYALPHDSLPAVTRHRGCVIQPELAISVMFLS